MERARPLRIRPLEWARDQSASARARAATAWKSMDALKRLAPLLTGASRNVVLAEGPAARSGRKGLIALAHARKAGQRLRLPGAFANSRAPATWMSAPPPSEDRQAP